MSMVSETQNCYDARHMGSRSSVLLTGGQSSRMGKDKSAINVFGEPLGNRLARLLKQAGWEPCVLGKHPIGDHNFKLDSDDCGGPLCALKQYHPLTDFVFVLSCDVPLFNSQIPELFLKNLGDFDAVIPEVIGRAQPLCALYRASAWNHIHSLKSSRVFDWIDLLSVNFLQEGQLTEIGIQPGWISGANTPAELSALIGFYPS